MQPWEKRDTETPAAFAAFCVYRDLGPARSLDKAYRIHTNRPDAVANGSWGTWSREHAWLDRCAAYEAHLEQREREEYEAELRKVARGRGRIDGTAQEALERTLEIAKRKLEYFETLEPSAVPLDEVARLVRLLATAIKTGGTGGPPSGGAAAAGPQQSIIREYVGVDVDAA